MSRKKKGIVKYFSVLLIVLIAAGLAIPASASADSAGVSLPVSQVFTNYTTMQVEDTFQYGLTPLEEGNPVPGTDEEAYSFSMKGTETVELEEIPLVRTGIYRYRLEQVVEKEKKGYIYDESVYTVELYVTNAAGGGLTAAILVYTEDGKKTDEISFENAYRKADETETNAPETEPITETEAPETEPVTKPGETEPVTETEAPETEPITKPGETEPITETEAPETEPATKLSETEPSETEPITKPNETEPVTETEAPETEPVTQPDETEPVMETEEPETEPVTKPNETETPGTTPAPASGNSPQTGDSSNLIFWFALLLLSAFCFAGVQITKIMGKRYRIEDKKN